MFLFFQSQYGHEEYGTCFAGCPIGRRAFPPVKNIVKKLFGLYATSLIRFYPIQTFHFRPIVSLASCTVKQIFFYLNHISFFGGVSFQAHDFCLRTHENKPRKYLIQVYLLVSLQNKGQIPKFGGYHFPKW